MKGKNFYVKCGSKYFDTKYGSPTVIKIEEVTDFHRSFNPPSFLYIGRVLAEGNVSLLRGITYYGHVEGQGEVIHESELGEEIKES